MHVRRVVHGFPRYAAACEFNREGNRAHLKRCRAVLRSRAPWIRHLCA